MDINGNYNIADGCTKFPAQIYRQNFSPVDDCSAPYCQPNAGSKESSPEDRYQKVILGNIREVDKCQTKRQSGYSQDGFDGKTPSNDFISPVL